MKDKFQETVFSIKHINLLCRTVFAIILLDFIIGAFSNTLVHQLQSPVLKFPQVDPTYWIMHLLHIPEFISSNIYFAWGLDILLFASCISVLIFPQKKWIIALFLVSYFIYYIIFNTYCIQHAHSQIPVLVAPIPFLFSRKSFSYTWEALRYFILFTYSAAFLWKFFRLSWLNHHQGILILKMNLTPYLIYNPDTLLAKMYIWFLHNPFWLETLCVTGFIFEGVFITGFFTKKFDRYLFYLSLVLPVGFWFFADVPFFEQIILSLTLLHFGTKPKSFKSNVAPGTG